MNEIQKLTDWICELLIGEWPNGRVRASKQYIALCNARSKMREKQAKVAERETFARRCAHLG